MDLKDRMQIGHVIRVRENGEIEDVNAVRAPEGFMSATWDEHGDPHIMKEDEAAYVESVESQGWTLLRGWSGAYLAGNTPIMHESEYIGGWLADHIRENPGLYVKLSVDIHPPNSEDGGECVDGDPECTEGMPCAACSGIESEYVGWVVAFRDTTCKGEGCTRQATPEDFREMCLECNPYGDCMAMNSDPEYLAWLFRKEL